jgi:hypothetical protein
VGIFFRANFIFFSALFLTSSAFAIEEGIYEGSMHLKDGEERTIPLSIALTLTGELDVESSVIAGAFLVDEEGGPYAFSKVSVDYAESRIDLRYDRASLNYGGNNPASLRFIGSLEEGDLISGRVVSGNRGPIGTFIVKRTDNELMETKTKYNGTWHGSVIRDGKKEFFSVTISKSLQSVVNANDFELDYTPGKLAHFVYKDTESSFNTVMIDYLRRTILLSRVSPEGVALGALEVKADFKKQSLNGEFHSIYKGVVGPVSMKRVNP